MKNENGLWSLLNQYHVVIPMIQRDYAQGRDQYKINKIRDNLLKAFFKTLKGEKETLKLDFIYGYTQSVNEPSESVRLDFFPLDGQQRLTTLYLLYWYIAVKENRREEAEPILGKFQYQTRPSAREFCNRLVKYQPEDLRHSLREHIMNQPWFFMDWINDPTISGMLRMLDAIQEMDLEYRLPDSWDRLTSDNPPIIFYLLPMDQLGLADDLYIKMNARGKELTEFEHFKVKFSELLEGDDRDEFNHKMDKEWSDLFWNLYKDEESLDLAKRVDEGVMRFFSYMTDMLDAKYAPEETPENGEMRIYIRVYKSKESVSFLFKVLTKMEEYYDKERFVGKVFSDYFYIDEKDFEPEKVRFFFQNPQIDLFKKCVDRYQPAARINPFSIGEQLILYACIVHFIDGVDGFPKKIRKIRNLISSSEDTLRKENIGQFIKEIEAILLNNYLEEETIFNKTQMNEEIEKQEILINQPVLEESIYRLEDHRLLQGSLGIFHLTASIDRYSKAFARVFAQGCDYKQISRALFTYGDYSQLIRNRWTLGGKNDPSWRSLFLPSRIKKYYERTKQILYKMLTDVANEKSLEDIIEEYLNKHMENPEIEKPWNYYYVKYEGFRVHEEGYYEWKNKQEQYVCMEIRKRQMNGYHWDPFLLTIYWKLRRKMGGSVHLGNYGSGLTISLSKGTIVLKSVNHGFQVDVKDERHDGFIEDAKRAGLLDESGVFIVRQSEKGLDLEDRTEKILKLIEFGS